MTDVPNPYALRSRRDKVLGRAKTLETERSSWMSQWQEINGVLLPRTGRFFINDTNRGDRKEDILDDTATAGVTTLGSGMQYGMTSPSRPWVKVETEDTDLMENADVSRWCDQVTQKTLTIFARSNVYNTLHQTYQEQGGYGTAAAVVLPDFDTVIHCYPMTIGEYCLAANDKNQIDTLGRHLQMTVMQIVQKFVARGRILSGSQQGWEWHRVSTTVKNLWDRGQFDTWVELYHLIEPRTDRDVTRMDAQNMPWASTMIEVAGDGDAVVNESGFRHFPVLAPRWEVTSNDVYGSNCPGMRALGAIKQLQFEHMRKMQGIDYQTNPPLQVPTSLKGKDSDFLPGGVSYYDEMTGSKTGVRSAFEVQLDLSALLVDIQDVRQLINNAFYVDTFLMLERMQGIQPRNEREVEERHQEKLLMLGPVVERQQNELLGPLIDITFDAAMSAGIYPPIPEALQGKPLKFVYTSVLAQAQRRASMAGVDRVIAATGAIAAAKQDPSVWDNVDVDQAIQKAGTYESVDPEIMRNKDDIARIRQARVEAQQRQQQAAEAEQAANTAKTLSQAGMTTDNALTQVVRGFSTQ
ncbi:portal protein [Variovorax sp.]|uniref:portal protein n=1 Tax=Variovorax sp. TaxID=1871043 RepID=UPI003BACA2A4